MNYLGIDLGGSKIAAGAVNESGRILAKVSRPSGIPCAPEELCRSMAQAALECLEQAGLSRDGIAFAGIGCPGSISRKTGVVEYSPNLFLNDFPMAERMERLLEKPVRIENDAKAAAYGEYRAGALRGFRNAACVTLGTGIGCGILIGGAIYGGVNGAAGEIGHTVIERGGRKCHCGRRGCWERYASATGLILTTREMMEQDPSSAIWSLVGGDPDRVTGKTAFDAMRMGDPTAKKIVERYVSDLSCGITNLINTFQPDAVCIGGGISNEGEALLAPVRGLTAREQFGTGAAPKTKILRAGLGNDAGIIGAALLGC
ncbi:MAG TPA: glucokinase [Ruminococcaceae bacterium]|nr:glucokinase [Oscillospiraceae bacterium]